MAEQPAKRTKKAQKTKKQFNITALICALMMIAVGSVILLVYAFSGTRTGEATATKEPDAAGQEDSQAAELTPEQALHRDYDNFTLELCFGDKTEKLTGSDVMAWITAEKTENGIEYKADREKTMEYVQKLAEKYDTFQPQYTFTTHWGEEKTLTNKSVGWFLHTEHASEKLANLIEQHRSQKLNLTDGSGDSGDWWARHVRSYDAVKKRGNTYAEVSIDQQYMWLIKDGECVLESPVVTGNPNTGNDTHTGAFVVENMVSPTTLSGPGYEDGIKVSYWIGFDYDIGFHDAVWVSYFGGDNYLYNGSHGCVNLPLDVAASLYQLSYVDMPVYVY